MAIDYSTDIGKVRLRVADVSELPFLPDEVYQGAITDCNGNLPEAAKICASYILGMLSLKTRKRMVQLEIFGNEAFSSYRTFLLDTLSNPALMSYTALPYLVTDDSGTNPLAQFTEDWNNCWEGENVTEMVNDLAKGTKAHPWDNV